MSATSPAQARVFIQDELDSAALYDTLARTRNGRAAGRGLSPARRRPSGGMRSTGSRSCAARAQPVPPHRLGWRARVLRWMARRFGAGDRRARSSPARKSPTRSATRTTPDRAPGMDADERGHARALRRSSGDRGARDRSSRGSRDAIATAAATRCAPRCSARTTASCRISASSWASPARAWRRARSSSPGSPACSRARARWRSANGSRSRARASSTRSRSASSARRSRRIPPRRPRSWRSSTKRRACRADAGAATSRRG